MDTTTAAAIQKAYQLMKEGKTQEAQAILVPIVKTNQNIAEAWFLLGFTMDDPGKRIYAFQQVLRIDPSNQAAQQQIDKLRAQRAQQAPKPSISPFTVMPDLSSMPEPEPAAEQPALVEQPIPEPTPVAELISANPELPFSGVDQRLEKERISPRFTLKPGLSRIQLLGGAVVLVALCAVVGIWWMAGNISAAQGLPFGFQPSPTPTPPPTVRPSPSPSPSPSPTAIYTPLFRSSSCPFTIPLGTRVRCGVVRVPQNRLKNFTDLIELPVVIYQSTKPSSDVVLFLQGGPGVESIDWSLALFQDYVTPILEEHDMVFFDPRGTGRSKPALDCPELNPVFIEAYYQNRPQDEAFQNFLKAWGKCHDRFTAEGVDPAAFNTTQSAADVRDIVLALGYEKVNLLGISYGTRLGLTVMRDYPEIVRAVVLDSVVPLEAKMFNRRGSDVQYALDKVFSDCAASARCNSAYPELANVFNILVRLFDREPATIKARDASTGFISDVKVNGVDMLSAIVWGMHNSELAPVVPKAIYDIQGGDYTFLSFALGVPGATYTTTGLGTYFATVCPEQVYVSTAEELDADLNVTALIKKFSLAGLFGSSQNIFELCKAWGAKADDPQAALPVKANIPALVISGQYDPTTPVTTGEMVANDLPDSHFFVIPGMGHGATIGNDCSFNIMMAFLKNPEKAPDSACLRPEVFEFFLPYDGIEPVTVVEMSDSANRLQGIVPAGWKKQLASGAYLRRAYLFDPTLVQTLSFNFAKNEVLDALASSFQDNGFELKPQRISTRVVNGLSWSIYASKFNGEPVIVGLAQVNTRRTLGLIMVVSAPEKDAFYNGLFLPMLDAIVPLQ